MLVGGSAGGCVDVYVRVKGRGEEEGVLNRGQQQQQSSSKEANKWRDSTTTNNKEKRSKKKKKWI